jgi:3'(2'), 5'-bisphosphate nucleotidase
MLQSGIKEKSAWVSMAKDAALEAGAVIMQVYNSMDFSIEYKSDQTPLTVADKTAHEIIQKKLASTGLPILSEEGKMIPYEERRHWDYFWLVDPLDGTKEFIKRTQEFTVNIALIKDQVPVIGVVYAPALGLLYWSDFEGSAWKQQNNNPIEQIYIIGSPKRVQTIVASKSHLTKETEEYIQQFPGASLQTIGSSLKFMLVAEGKADCYPRFGPTMEWDTAAAHAIVEAAGARVLYHDRDESLQYNKEDLLNPFFLVRR